jgi:hypothetical protein
MHKSTLLLSTAVGLTALVAGPALAAKHELPAGVKSHAPLAGKFKTSGLTHGAIKTPGKGAQLSEAWGTTTTFNIPFSLTPYDFISGSCKGRSTCTVEIENLLQVFSFASVKEGVAIEPVVNGYFANGAGYWQYQDSADEFVNQGFRANATVNAGSYTATDYVYSSASLEMGHHQSDYSAWKN